MRQNLHRFSVPILIIFVLGLILRSFRIGSNYFWVYGLGVARAAYASSLIGVLSIVKSHVMAIPLDYNPVWIMGHFSTSEGWLRLPEALWGTLTLAAAYVFYRDHVSRRSALFGIFILAITPILIRYSQELRFYAPPVFFYALCTAIGLKAVRTGTLQLWVTYTLLSIIRVFFHLYVAFAFINVAFSFVSRSLEKKRSLISIITSFLFIFGSAVIAVLQFGKLAGNPSGLFDYENPVQVVGARLGVALPFNAPPEAFIFGLVILLFTLVGPWYFREQLPLAVSALVQTLVILALDFWRSYFASALQLLPLLPMLTLFTAKGVEATLEHISLRNTRGVRRYIPAARVVLLLFVGSLLLPVPCYRAGKTSTKDILITLKADWKLENKYG